MILLLLLLAVWLGAGLAFYNVKAGKQN